MATASLTNMTVPLASDQSSPTQGLLMPKLSYRFRVTFLNFGVSTPTTELTKQVIKFDRPKLSFEEIKLPVYNSTVKIAGKYTWGDSVCEIRDDAGGNVSRLVGEQLQKQLDFMEQSSAASGIDYKFITQFEILDGGNGTQTPVVLETWELLGCYLHDVNYNGADYGTSEAMRITITIKFDNAVQNPLGQGVGATIPRTLGDIATGAGVG
jgi:hypothetical protein